MEMVHRARLRIHDHIENSFYCTLPFFLRIFVVSFLISRGADRLHGYEYILNLGRGPVTHTSSE